METELTAMRTRLEQTATELEEAKLVAADKVKLEETQSQLTTTMQQLQAERDQLTRQLNQQKIVLAEFPELAPLASYIPIADSDDAFKENAKTFQTALQQYVKATIQGSFEGSAPPDSSQRGSTDGDEVEKLWADVYKLAGIPGKEQEYAEANRKLQEAIKTT
jgi:hypothetical protein